MAPIVVGRDDRALRDSARRVGAVFARDPKDALEGSGDHAPVGTVDQVVERLKGLEELGYERVMLQHLAHKDLDTVALICCALPWYAIACSSPPNAWLNVPTNA